MMTRRMINESNGEMSRSLIKQRNCIYKTDLMNPVVSKW